MQGFMQMSGVMMGAIVHILLIIGFVYYLFTIPKQQKIADTPQIS
jgi:hypothetical protein